VTAALPEPVAFTTEVVVLCVTPELAEHIQDDLRQRGLFLFRIPVQDEAEDAMPSYAVGIGRTLWEAAQT
jgi:hypothetical protein